PQLMSAFVSKDEKTAQAASMALSMMGSIPVDSLVKMLTDADPKVTQRAENTLMAIGAPAIPGLLKALRSK
ncbi:MAG: HEAT repeat domain-containing protein, partial [Desulfomonilaceae bacterium]